MIHTAIGTESMQNFNVTCLPLFTIYLDVCAPFKTFKIKSHYKFGLSDETKDLMLKRDNTRLQI